MEVCQRCGKCCRPCRYLIELKNGRTVCRVYRVRLKTKIDKDNFCDLRSNSIYDYIGCPFNTDKPIKEARPMNNCELCGVVFEGYVCPACGCPT